MAIRSAIIIGCRLALVMLALGYFTFVLPGVALGLAMASDVPWTLVPALIIGSYAFLPPALLILGWWLVGKIDLPAQP